VVRRKSNISAFAGAVVVTLAATAFAPAAAVTVGAGGAATVPVALKAVYSIGEAGRGDGQLSEPTDVAVDSAGRLYVADSRNARVQLFDAQGFFETTIGRFGWEGEGLVSPYGVALDQDLYIYVSDREREPIHQ